MSDVEPRKRSLRDLSSDEIAAAMGLVAMGALSRDSMMRKMGMDVDYEYSRMREEHSRMIPRLPDRPAINYTNPPIIDYPDRIGSTRS